MGTGASANKNGLMPEELEAYVAATTFNKTQLQRLWKRFNILDRTGNGRITRLAPPCAVSPRLAAHCHCDRQLLLMLELIFWMRPGTNSGYYLSLPAIPLLTEYSTVSNQRLAVTLPPILTRYKSHTHTYIHTQVLYLCIHTKRMVWI